MPAEIARDEARLAAIRQAKAQDRGAGAAVPGSRGAGLRGEGGRTRGASEQVGQEVRRKPPKPPTGGVREWDQISLTGDESRIMKAADGGFEQDYNAQALIEVDSKLIVGALVTRHLIDVQQSEPALAV